MPTSKRWDDPEALERQIKFWWSVRDRLEYLKDEFDQGNFSPHSRTDAEELAHDLEEAVDTIRKFIRREWAAGPGHRVEEAGPGRAQAD